MTFTLTPVNINTDKWRVLIERVNELVAAANTIAITTNSNPTVGSATITGTFSANALYDSNVRVVTQSRTVSTGAGLTGGGSLANNLTISLNTNISASLQRADTAVQPEDLGSAAYTSIDTFATAVQGAKADAALPASNYTAEDVLAKIKTVDGSGSGLNADQVRDTNPSATGLSILGAANATVVKTLLGAGTANGLATLDAGGRVPSTELPSYVDDVLEYANIAAFPVKGERGKIYVAINDDTPANPAKQYRWSGTVYSEINPSPGTTDDVPEGSTNKYYTDVRVRSTTLSGYVIGSNTSLASTDTLINALGKIQAQINARSLPARLGAAAQIITDWNTATQNGWYMGSGAANDPTSDAGLWYIGEVISHGSGGWCVQTVEAFTVSDGTYTASYRREQTNGTWGEWMPILITRAEMEQVFVKNAQLYDWND